MHSIVVTEPMALSKAQLSRLQQMAPTTVYNTRVNSGDEWLDRVAGHHIICVGKLGLEDKIYELRNKFLSLPYVGVHWIDMQQCRQNNVLVSYAPGCNRHAVAEWVVGMMIVLARRLHILSRNKTLSVDEALKPAMGLSGKKVAILGAGQVGLLTGSLCQSFGMQVQYFDRNLSLTDATRNADFVVNALGVNPSTIGLLNRDFFFKLKKGSIFISIAWQRIYDVDALIEAIDAGIIEAAADDAGEANIGDVTDPLYQKLMSHPKVLATPHIAFNTDVAARTAYDMMIDNIEAYLNNDPQNLL